MATQAYGYRQDAGYLVSWYVYVVWYELRETWRALPGPWYVKVLLTAICLAIPFDPWDEIVLLAIVKFARMRKVRKEKSRADKV
jgi:hypothetical protein